jgi:hypothetical protein
MNKHHLLIIGAISFAAAMYFGGAATGTGVYASPLVGNWLNNIWTSGNNIAVGSAGST